MTVTSAGMMSIEANTVDAAGEDSYWPSHLV
jgi:hypothetical protein